MGLSPEVNREIIRLKDKIVGGFSESNWQELALLTNSRDYVASHHRLLRSLRFGDEDYAGHVLSVLHEMVRSDINNLKIIHGYVARIAPDVGEYVSAEPAARVITFAPNVFKVPNEEIDTSLVAVMMPFLSDFDDVYAAIQSAASGASLVCQRADDIWKDSVIVQDIFGLIFRAWIVVVDFTGRNPNVMYETGIAHTLGRHVVPISQSKQDVPFDLQHHRYLPYLNNAEGRTELTKKLSKRLTSIRSDDLPTPWSK